MPEYFTRTKRKRQASNSYRKENICNLIWHFINQQLTDNNLKYNFHALLYSYCSAITNPHRHWVNRYHRLAIVKKFEIAGIVTIFFVKNCQNGKGEKRLLQEPWLPGWCILTGWLRSKDHEGSQVGKNDALVNTSTLAWLCTGDVEEGETRGFVRCDESMMTRLDSTN